MSDVGVDCGWSEDLLFDSTSKEQTLVSDSPYFLFGSISTGQTLVSDSPSLLQRSVSGDVSDVGVGCGWSGDRLPLIHVGHIRQARIDP